MEVENAVMTKGEGSQGNLEMHSAYSTFQLAIDNPSGDVSEEVRHTWLEVESSIGKW